MSFAADPLLDEARIGSAGRGATGAPTSGKGVPPSRCRGVKAQRCRGRQAALTSGRDRAAGRWVASTSGAAPPAALPRLSGLPERLRGAGMERASDGCRARAGFRLAGGPPRRAAGPRPARRAPPQGDDDDRDAHHGAELGGCTAFARPARSISFRRVVALAVAIAIIIAIAEMGALRLELGEDRAEDARAPAASRPSRGGRTALVTPRASTTNTAASVRLAIDRRVGQAHDRRRIDDDMVEALRQARPTASRTGCRAAARRRSAAAGRRSSPRTAHCSPALDQQSRLSSPAR